MIIIEGLHFILNDDMLPDTTQSAQYNVINQLIFFFIVIIIIVMAFFLVAILQS